MYNYILCNTYKENIFKEIEMQDIGLYSKCE